MRATILILLVLCCFQKTFGQSKGTKNTQKSTAKKTQIISKKPVANKTKPVEIIPVKTETPLKKDETPIINQNNVTNTQPNNKTQSAPPSTVQKTNPPNNIVASKSSKDKKRQANDNTFEIGFQGGMNSSTLTTNPLRSNGKVNLMGWNLGFIFNIPLSQKISLQPEINYTNHGLKYSYESDYEKLTMKYIEMPLVLKYNIIKGKTGKVYLQAGGYSGYWLSAELENKTNQEIIKEQYPFDDDISDGFKDNRIDYGLIGGIGATIKSNSGGLIFFQARYQHGLSDIAKFSTTPSNYTPSFHSIISATIGYSIIF